MKIKVAQLIKGIIFLLCLTSGLTHANAPLIKTDKVPINLHDLVALQRGAKIFVNYCLHCHSASYMRYNRLQDLGLTEQQIKDHLLLAGEKVGDTMTIAMTKKDAKEWFGAVPPDLSVIARSRSPDWLYTYMRSFYRDNSRPTGWNNLLFDKVGMPHVLYQLQGEQELKIVQTTDGEGHKSIAPRLVLEKPGTLTKVEYDLLVKDLVNYLVYMGEPAKTSRELLGIIVLLFLSVLFVLSYALKKEYWKNVH